MPKFVTFKNLEQYNDKIYPKIKNLETDVGQVVDPATHTPIEATKTSAGVVQLATAQDIENGTANKVVDAKELADAIRNLNPGGSSFGAGLEVGDIALAPLGIDETDNCRRYLNGQVILQNQFVAFTEKLKHAITLYPNLATTEQNWQSAVTLSPLGQCGKFVIDDENGTIRLPKVVNVMGALDLSTIGQTVEAGLPNISGSAIPRSPVGDNSRGLTIDGYSGCLTKAFSNQQVALATLVSYTPSTQDIGINFNASNSNSIYGNSTTVQQEAIKYPYFIQVATSNTEDVQIDTQVRLNNPFSLFMPYWSPIELNNLSWLRSNKQWNNGAVYTSAYEFLLSKYNSGTEQTENIKGVSVTYKLADNGMKIITDKSKYDALISACGSAFFFVLDTENTQFVLPYTNGFMQFGDELGKFTEAGVPNITGYFDIVPSRSGYTGTGPFNSTLIESNAQMYDYNRGMVTSSRYGIAFVASQSSPIYKDGVTTVQPNSITGYLYFYIGEVEQDANIIATSGLAESISRKLDIEGASSVGMPSGRYVYLSPSATKFTAIDDGYIMVQGEPKAPSHAYIYAITSNNYTIKDSSYNGEGMMITFPLRKGTQVDILNNGNVNIYRILFIYAEGAK